VDDDFDGTTLDENVWIAHYLPHWSSRAATAARYDIADGKLILRIDHDQPPWSPEFDGWTRVSSLQTGLFAGPVGSGVGQLRFRPDLVVREAQQTQRRYTQHLGLIEARVRVPRDPANMAALWMIGLEDEPGRSGEICIAEIFGRNIDDAGARVGMGIHPFADPRLVDEFSEEPVSIEPDAFHVYSAEWRSDGVGFFVDDALVKVVRQSPDYPMQIMLGLYEFADGPEPVSARDAYPKRFEVDWFRGYRPRAGTAATARHQAR
jgi:Glycosyl hydrolases family 16